MKKQNFLYITLLILSIGFYNNIFSMVQTLGLQSSPLDPTIQALVNASTPMINYVTTGLNNNKLIIAASLVAGSGIYALSKDLPHHLLMVTVVGIQGLFLVPGNELIHHVLYEGDMQQAGKVSLITLAGAYAGFKIASMTHDEYLAYINPPAPVIRKR